MPDQSEIQEVNQIIARARIAQNEYEKYGSQEKYDNAAQAVGWAIMEPKRNKELAELAVSSTGLGNVNDKITKNYRKTLGLLRDISNVKTYGIIDENIDKGITKIARAIGVIGAPQKTQRKAFAPRTFSNHNSAQALCLLTQGLNLLLKSKLFSFQRPYIESVFG